VLKATPSAMATAVASMPTATSSKNVLTYLHESMLAASSSVQTLWKH
jgi:hypothetical protein